MTRLALEQVSLSLRGRRVVSDVSATFPAAGVTALVGPNGAGKSTLLRLLGGLWRPGSGRVLLRGRDLSQLRAAQVARRIAWVPQSAELHYAFTAAELVAMGLFGQRRTIAQRHDAVDAALTAVNAGHLAQRLVTELSAGERQRILLARAMATSARVLLFDEPTANLDPRHALQILSLLRQFSGRGRTVVLVLHDLTAALRFADHVVLLSEGSVLAAGPAEQVLTPQWIERAFGVAAECVRSEQGGAALVYHPSTTEGEHP